MHSIYALVFCKYTYDYRPPLPPSAFCGRLNEGADISLRVVQVCERAGAACRRSQGLIYNVEGVEGSVLLP